MAASIVYKPCNRAYVFLFVSTRVEREGRQRDTHTHTHPRTGLIPRPRTNFMIRQHRNRTCHKMLFIPYLLLVDSCFFAQYNDSKYIHVHINIYASIRTLYLLSVCGGTVRASISGVYMYGCWCGCGIYVFIRSRPLLPCLSVVEVGKI